MVHRHVKPLAATLLLVLSMTLLAGAGPANPRPSLRAQQTPYSASIPNGLRPSPSTAVPGQQVDITVTLNQPTTTDQSVSVGASDPTAFTSFPSYVIVPAGADHAMFQVFVQSNAAPEPITLSASCNGATVYTPMAVGTASAG